MSLEPFCNGRLVVLRASATAYDAARAMFNNHVGAVLVAERGQLIGIATDRDVLLRAGRKLTLDRIPLREIMTPQPATLDASASIDDAARLMRERRIRRVVVLEGGEPRGLVTLDDLILAHATPREDLEDIVLAQLEQGAPAKPRGEVRPVKLQLPSARRARRSEAHRTQTLHDFGTRLQRITGLGSGPEALAAFEEFASSLTRRLGAAEAGGFTAQLPALLRERLPPPPRYADRNISRATIERDVARRLDLDEPRATEVVWRLAQHLGDLVSEGEARHVVTQLPKKLQTIFHLAA